MGLKRTSPIYFTGMIETEVNDTKSRSLYGFDWRLGSRFCFALILIFLWSCSRWTESNNPRNELKSLEQASGITLPTNYSNLRAASWSYRAPLDGNSKTFESIAKMLVDLSSFESWRSISTNKLEEYINFTAVDDPRLTDRFSWWDCSNYRGSDARHYYREAPVASGGSMRLEIFVIPSDDKFAVYIHALIITH
jgi:hypothetical protein